LKGKDSVIDLHGLRGKLVFSKLWHRGAEKMKMEVGRLRWGVDSCEERERAELRSDDKKMNIDYIRSGDLIIEISDYKLHLR
jgi:hypothetical protein